MNNCMPKPPVRPCLFLKRLSVSPACQLSNAGTKFYKTYYAYNGSKIYQIINVTNPYRSVFLLSLQGNGTRLSVAGQRLCKHVTASMNRHNIRQFASCVIFWVIRVPLEESPRICLFMPTWLLDSNSVKIFYGILEGVVSCKVRVMWKESRQLYHSRTYPLKCIIWRKLQVLPQKLLSTFIFIRSLFTLSACK